MNLDLDRIDPARWEAISRVLEIVLELPAEEVDAALDRLCAGDPSVRDGALKVLRADRSASGFLGRSALGFLKPRSL